MKKIYALLLMTIFSQLTACGGGGGGGSSTTPLSPPQPTAAVMKLSASGTLASGKAVAGFGVTIDLPAGVTVKTITGGSVDATVVVGSGLLAGTNGTMGPVTYTPATSTTKAKIDFTIASTAAAGVGIGEYATINFILSGVSPAATDFVVTSFKPVDLSFTDITTLAAVKTVTLM